jgi:hypothetical protein
VHTGFWWGNLSEGDHLEDQDVDGKIMLKWDLGMGWINMAQDRDRWCAFVNPLMNLWMP